MNNEQINGHSSLQNGSDEDFELMGDMPKEDPIIVEVKSFTKKKNKKKKEFLYSFIASSRS